MKITSTIMVPVAYEGEGDSTKVILSKKINHSVPLSVGMEIVDKTLTIQGTKRAKLIIKEIQYFLDSDQCVAIMKKVSIQPKFIPTDKWKLTEESDISPK